MYLNNLYVLLTNKEGKVIFLKMWFSLWIIMYRVYFLGKDKNSGSYTLLLCKLWITVNRSN